MIGLVIILDNILINESVVQYQPEILKSMFHLRAELDEIIETMEIISNRELLEGIKKSLQDIEAGNLHELDVDNLDELWSDE